MAESKPVIFGNIFRRYVGTNSKGNRVRIPVTFGDPSSPSYVNVFLTVGETIDFIDALQDAIEVLRQNDKKGG